MGSSDRDSTKPAAGRPPPSKGRPLALDDPLPSGKQNSDDDSDQGEHEDDESDDTGEHAGVSTSSPQGQSLDSARELVHLADVDRNDADNDNEEVESNARFGRRKLVSNQDRYEEKTEPPVPGEEGQQMRYNILTQMIWINSSEVFVPQKSPMGKRPTRWNR